MACLLSLGMQAQSVFRFAQLTDLHLSPNNPNPTEDLLRSVAQINATDNIDFVLVTGDITEEGDRGFHGESEVLSGFAQGEVLRGFRKSRNQME